MIIHLLRCALPALLLIAAPVFAGCPACAGTARSFAEKERFNGIVLVGHGGTADYLGSFGAADVDTGTPLGGATRFDTGSISKWISAVVVLRLVQQGQLSLDEPISTYLPWYRHDTGQKLTLRTLMSHSSGVPNQLDDAIKRDPSVKEQPLDNVTAVERYASGDLRFEPGTDWDYSHSNWLIVKAVVEATTGKNYPSLVHDFIVEPLGLADSGTWEGMSSVVPGMALGYSTLSPTPIRLDKPTPGFMVMAGGFYTSADDMLRILDGLFSGKLLSPPMVTTLLRVVRPSQSYALGGRTKLLKVAGKQRLVAWEYGSNGAYRVLAWRVIDDGHTIVIMNNTSFDHLKIGELATQLLDATYR
jgi:CubicO group peptidase (beta-lactamase class C family)